MEVEMPTPTGAGAPATIAVSRCQFLNTARGLYAVLKADAESRSVPMGTEKGADLGIEAFWRLEVAQVTGARYHDEP